MFFSFDETSGVANVSFSYQKASSHSASQTKFLVFFRRFMIGLAFLVILGKNLDKEATLLASL